MSDVYDPEVVDEKLKEVDACEFGRRVAQQIVEMPSSNYWALIGYAFGHIDKWALEHEQIQELIERIAKE